MGRRLIKSIMILTKYFSSENIKIAVHKKVCNNNNCKVNMLNKSKISDELKTTIIRKAALLQKVSKKKK